MMCKCHEETVELNLQETGDVTKKRKEKKREKDNTS